MSCFTAGMSAASWIRDGDGATVTIVALCTAALSAHMVKKGYQWERDNQPCCKRCQRILANAESIHPDSKPRTSETTNDNEPKRHAWKHRLAPRQ